MAFLLKAVAEKFTGETVGAGVSWIQRVRSAEPELRKLHDTARRIQALLSDAEERRLIENESVLLWLRELKAIALDAEDLSDRFDTLKSLAKRDAGCGGSSRKRKRFDLDSLVDSDLDALLDSLLDSWLVGADLATRVEDIKSRYGAVNDDRKNLRFRKGETKRRVLTRHSPNRHGPLHDASEFHGRKDETDEIIRFLTSGGSPIVSVVSIVGAGGLGKTALAQKIFGHERVAQHFNLKGWVDLSQGSDLMQTTKKIVEALTKEQCRLCSLDAMQHRLRQLVAGQRVLLVLDGMWGESSNFDDLRLPLLGAENGSKILITTQNEMVSKHMRAELPLNLDGLPEGDCWLLFQDRAFVGGRNSTVLEDNPTLEAVGMEIVKKCQGSPLAVRSIGSLLYSVTDGDEWESVLNDLADIEAVNKSILPALKVSYDHLSLQLKRCFAFCSIFPNGSEFDKDELGRLWMAVGFIQPSGNTPLENACGRCFGDLLGRSFFQPCDGNQKHNQKYRMPGKMHDLARHVSKYECLRSEADVVQAVKRAELKWARYAFCTEPTTFERLGESESLRTLILRCEDGIREQVLSEAIEKMTFLRVLDLSNSQLEVWPDSINGLILLRYLSMGGTKVKSVPGSVRLLHNLQTLELGKCDELREISESIGELEHLRYLGLSQTAIKRLPESVGRLCNLQNLELGGCERLQELPNSIGGLKCLRYLVLHHTPIERLPPSVTSLCNLHTLELGGCDMLVELPEGISKLAKLRHLGLRLDWESWDGGKDLDSVPSGIGKLTSLQTLSRFTVGSGPGCGIRELKGMMNIRGELCISKLENVVDVPDAEEASLKDKRHIEFLMLRWSNGACSSSHREEVIAHQEEVIGRLRPHNNLKYLWIENYSGVSLPSWIADPAFSGLEKLRLSGCQRCHVIPFLGQLAHLSELIVSHCPALKELTRLPPSLRKFELRQCPRVGALPTITSLQHLEVEGGSGAIFKWIKELTSLWSLTVSHFSRLEHLRRADFRPLTSLRILKVKGCQKLVSLGENGGLTDLTSLVDLEISSCPGLTSMPELPDGVQHLTIKNCQRLQQWCQGEGADWLRLQRIPNLNIDD